MSWSSDLAGMLRGLERVRHAMILQQRTQLRRMWKNSSVREAFQDVGVQTEECISSGLTKQTAFQVFNTIHDQCSVELSIVESKSSCPVSCVLGICLWPTVILALKKLKHRTLRYVYLHDIHADRYTSALLEVFKTVLCLLHMFVYQ